MSIDVLFGLRSEVRRLFIAGSGMAVGDVRLQRVLPQLQKLGESAPIFKRMAQAVGELLEADVNNSAAKLLELGTLLESVLYTQGKTETAGERVPLQGTSIGLTTAYSYRKLQPVKEALASKGQGRLEVLRSAYDNGVFADFRLLDAAVEALDESYAEIVELLQRKVLPGYGSDAVPALKRRLRLDGGKGDARRLELLHEQWRQTEEGLELLLNAVREGSTEVRAAAVELLGQYPNQEPYLLELADDKRKEVRQAALFALAKLDTPLSVERLFRALKSAKDRDLAIEPIVLCSSVALAREVMAFVRSLVEQAGQDAKPETVGLELLAAIRCLEANKPQEEVRRLLEELLAEPAFIRAETEAAQERAIETLLAMNSPEADRFVMELRDAYKGKFFGHSFHAALRRLSPAEVFDHFSSGPKVGGKYREVELLRAFREETNYLRRGRYEQLDFVVSDDGQPLQVEWDPRWVRLFVKLDQEELVWRLVQSPDREIEAYLLNKCKAAPDLKTAGTVHSLLALFRLRHPDAPELLMDIVEQTDTKQIYYMSGEQRDLLALLPRRYAERLQKAADAMAHNHMKRQLTELAEQIAAKPEEENDYRDEEKGLGIWAWIRSKLS
ncbi:HEAT repeat domain-containing protein [Paenibacillus koleovorans]|uniref:HEAT repeat domain-containing protein n=1 Tax=Paenibacillus koleovorans TaxID=121608 RepID=UPI000FDA54A1|nr:HEAT repeat domain-containing protein [Paenibacillus koleovorans]